MTSRIPLHLIKKELEQYGMTIEELETSAKRIRTSLETLSRSKRGIKCPNCGLPNMTLFLEKSSVSIGGDPVVSGQTRIDIKHKVEVKAICNTQGCKFRDEYRANEVFEMMDAGTWKAIENDLIIRWKKRFSTNVGTVYSDDIRTNRSMWDMIKRGGFVIGYGLGGKKVSGTGVVASMIRRPTFSSIIAGKLRDLNPSQRQEFLNVLDSMGISKAEEFLGEVKAGNVPKSAVRPVGRPKKGRGRPKSPREKGEWYSPSSMTRMELDIVDVEINRINKEE